MLNIKSKIITFYSILCAIVLALLIGNGLTSHASTHDVDFNDSDKTKYNTDWSYGNAKHWTYSLPLYKGAFWWKKLDKYVIYNFIRLEDKDGNLLDASKVTHLVAKFKVNGIEYVKEEDNILLINGGRGQAPLNDVSGTLFYSNENNGIMDDLALGGSRKYIVKDLFKDKKYAYESTNLCWYWQFDSEKYVTEIMEMYVWYIDESSTGEKVEIATSFVNDKNYNGLHPMYDENGALLGIYDSDGNLANGYSLSKTGMICNVDGEEIDLSDEQTKGSIVVPIPNEPKINNSIERIIQMALGIIGCIAIIYVINLILRFFEFLPKKKVGKRK